MRARMVSVIVPAYEQAQYLPACLDRLAHQEYPDLEIIVVADASRDGTERVAREFVRDAAGARAHFVRGFEERPGGWSIRRAEASRYPAGRRWALVTNGAPVGATEAYNQGVRLATGDYCTYVAADDLPHPDMIGALVGALEQTPADFAYSDMLLVDDVGRVLRRIETLDWDFERCLCDWYRLGVSKLYRRSLHEAAGYYDPRYRLANDYDMYLRFAVAGARFARVPRALYSVRYHGDGRKTGQHAPENERRIFAESVEIARRARAFGAESLRSHAPAAHRSKAFGMPVGPRCVLQEAPRA